MTLRLQFYEFKFLKHAIIVLLCTFEIIDLEFCFYSKFNITTYSLYLIDLYFVLIRS